MDRPARLTCLALVCAAFVALLGASTCTRIAPVPRTSTGTKSAPPLAGSRTTLRIATFNIQNLGPTKLSNEAIVSELVSLIRKYDVVAVQEIDDRTLRTPDAFLARINALPGPKYAMRVSRLTGRTASAGEDEQYAFFYNSEKVDAVGDGELYPDPQDVFIREPFAAQLRPTHSSESVVLLTIHTQATKAGAAREIAALASAAQWAANHFEGELGVVVLGDFNAGATYLKATEVATIRAAHLPYRWIVPDDADTNITSQKDQAHDRIVVIGPQLDGRYSGSWGIDRTLSGPAVSDHLPVWADFWFAGNN